MKKRILLLALVLVCAMALSACGCKHETWLDADCVTPKTCAECGETEGAPLGHTWAAATCLTPKTCEVCGETEGEALGHTWVDADCVNPKTCSACKETEGEALGHIWLEATTEAPETCETCGETQGERIISDPRFTTAACQPLFGTWVGEVTIPGSVLGEPLDQYVDELPVDVTLVLNNDGTMTMIVLPKDEEQMVDIMIQFTKDLIYAELASSGLSEAEIDAAMEQTYGMSMDDYIRSEMENMELEEYFTQTGVYYVDGDKLYLGESWDDVLESDTFELEDGVLYLPLDDVMTAFTRVEE